MSVGRRRLSGAGRSFVFGQLMVALTFAEAASHYPLAGGVYQWAKHLVNGSYGWFAAWMFAFAVLIAVAGVAIGASPIVCSLAGWSGTSQQLFWIAFAFIVGSMVLNIYGVKIHRLLQQHRHRHRDHRPGGSSRSHCMPP